MSHVRELDQYQEAQRKLGRPGKTPDKDGGTSHQCSSQSKSQSKSEAEGKTQSGRRVWRSRCLIAEEATGGCGKAGPNSLKNEVSQPPLIEVPGSGVSTFSGQGILQSLLRHALSSRCRLGGFARSMVFPQQAAEVDQQTSNHRALFPMPLKFPEVLSKSTEVRRGAAKKKGLCALVIVLNFLHLGKPLSCDPRLSRRVPLTREQWQAVERLGKFYDAWVSVSPIDAEVMGRTASKFESLESVSVLNRSIQGYVSQNAAAPQVPIPGRSLGQKVGESSQDSLPTFKPIDASRLSFIGTPSFDPTPYLNKQAQDIFNDPMGQRKMPFEVEVKPPPLKVFASRNQKIKLFELLDSSNNRLAAHVPSEVTPAFGSGFFAVVKDLEKDRLILDSRGANLLETAPREWIKGLASGDNLLRLVLRPQEKLIASGNDLRDFYYLFKATKSRCRRNVLSEKIHAREVSHLSCVGPEHVDAGMIHMSLATLAMGDTQAVELAQTCHLGLGYQNKVITSETLLSLQSPPPRGDTAVGIVIDDFISLSKVALDHPTDVLSPAARLADEMQSVYKSVNLVPHEKKAFRDCEQSNFWGIDLDGVGGIVRGALKRAIPLTGIILKMVKIGFATADLLQVIAGALLSLLLYRRRLMALLDSLFDSYRNRMPRDIIKLEGPLKSDLLSLCCLLPVAGSNLRARISPRITATDASNWGEAGVVADIPPKAAEELYRHALKKNVWTRLLNPSSALLRSKGLLPCEEELPNPGEAFRYNPLWEKLAKSLTFKLQFKQSASSHRRINIGEVKSVLKAEKLHGLKDPCSREIYGIDSQVALGALLKGRASSPAINSLLCQSLPHMLACESYFEGMYFSSKSYPSDERTCGIFAKLVE